VGARWAARWRLPSLKSSSCGCRATRPGVRSRGGRCATLRRSTRFPERRGSRKELARFALQPLRRAALPSPPQLQRARVFPARGEARDTLGTRARGCLCFPLGGPPARHGDPGGRELDERGGVSRPAAAPALVLSRQVHRGCVFVEGARKRKVPPSWQLPAAFQGLVPARSFSMPPQPFRNTKQPLNSTPNRNLIRTPWRSNRRPSRHGAVTKVQPPRVRGERDAHVPRFSEARRQGTGGRQRVARRWGEGHGGWVGSAR